MFYLHVSNRTENLLRHLIEVMRADRQVDIFATELFLIQSQGMERMIAQTLAEEFQSFCNYRFFLPLEFLKFIADKLGNGQSSDAFTRQILTWRIEGLLRDLPGEEYQPLHLYLSGENGDLKRFQLARRLANIFDQYQLMRPEMLKEWECGNSTGSHAAEKWQMALWRRLLLQKGGESHRGKVLQDLTLRLGGKENLSGLLPKRISVVGLHTIAPILLQYLNNLARHMDIHLLLLSPCKNYWGNVESQRAHFMRLTKNRVAQVTKEEAHHPLLIGLGRQGRDLQNLMLEHVNFAMDFSSYQDPFEDGKDADGTLLHQLQKDILEDLVPTGNQKTLTQDDSIQVVSCHSKMRELAVLKDYLLRLLHQNPELELREIIVMAPDIQEYVSLIPAVFNDIQHSIADRSTRSRNHIIGAFADFLDLFVGRFGWSEVLDLLRKKSIFPQFDLTSSDLDTLQQWIVGSGIRWGLSGNQRVEEALPAFEESSWKAGLDRLLMGFAIDSDYAVDGIFPYSDIEGRAALALGGLCSFIEIIEGARRAFKQARTLRNWSETLLHIVQQLFGNNSLQELVELRALLTELPESTQPFHQKSVSFRVMKEWFNLSTKESRSSSGFLRGQLTFCSMLPMRSIPFRVVCLIGLCDGVFPKNDRHDTFDLMGSDPRPGDRSPRADDRYQFLEALLAARSHLYLSYIGQSIRTNEVIPPSVVVTEFLELLEDRYGAKNIVTSHPLHPFSRKYFTGEHDSRLFSYNGYFCKTAEILQLGPEPTEHWWQGKRTIDEQRLPLSELLKFYNHPQKYFIKDCLSIRLDSFDDLPEERELFELSGLEKYHVEKLLVEAVMKGESDALLHRLQAEGSWALGQPGALSFEEKLIEIETFVQTIEDQQMGEKCPDLQLDIILAGTRLFGPLGNLYNNGALLFRYGKMRGRDLLSAWIHHRLLCLVNLPRTTRLVTLDGVVGFSGTAGMPDLETLIKHYFRGCQSPSSLFVEPALIYARQSMSVRTRVPPIEKALQFMQIALENGYEKEWELLYGATLSEDTLGPDFQQLCEELMCPILESIDAW